MLLWLTVFGAGAALAFFIGLRQRRALQEAGARRDAENSRLVAELTAKQAELSDTQSHLAGTAAALEEVRERLGRIEGLGEIEDALQYSQHVRTQANEELSRASSLRQQAQEGLQQALHGGELERARIIREAEAQAREIAGSAYELAKRETVLKKVLQSLEHSIKGYGDEYLLPTSSLLDELEVRYGFTDAGQKLKEARKRVSEMIKSGTAATCDYVETNRRETAIAFVLDAFNGKVDSAVSSIRHDNYGKLQQRINDAYVIINHLGNAFRNARIEPAYLTAQLEMLRWGVAAQELKRLEAEEQRALREQMREEEKARKEYDKALKEASRDEEVARKALEKARADWEKAGDAERGKFEARLAELTAKLQLAEEKGRRALSMAQQTRAGNVYIISNVGSFGDNVFKIGMTRRLEPEERVKELGDASVPFSFDIHAMIRTEDAPALENALHRRFLREQVNKVNPRKEFFKLHLADIKAEVEKMGIQASWTMTASCSEWRESQVIAERLLKDESELAKWAAAQIREHDRATSETAEVDE